MTRIVRSKSLRCSAVLCLLAVSASAAVLQAAGEPNETDASRLAARILDDAGFSGGLIVHVGCGDGRLTAALCGRDASIVEGLDADQGSVDRARALFRSLGLSGKVTAQRFDGAHLPYADNLVNLVVAEDLGAVPTAEVMRVLAPNGVAFTKAGGEWKKTAKPWPADLDQWTHFHHDPEGTMVGHDTVVGPPRRIQWLAGPKWLRNHDFMSSMHAMVSAEGRIFYVIDEGLRNHIFLPARWTLIARDGFNGALLWKKPLADWHPNNWPLKSGPGHNPRKLVAVGDRVYVAAGVTEPVQAFDAASGRLVQTYEGTRPTQEILVSDSVLYLVVDPQSGPVGYSSETTTYKEINRANTGWAWTPESPERAVMAVEADTGRLLWRHAAKVAPLSLTVGGEKIFYHNGAGLAAIDRATGAERWTTPGPAVRSVPTGGSLRVVFCGEVVLFADGTKLTAFSSDEGEQLWTGSLMKTSHHCPEDLFVIDDGIWSVNTGRPQENGTHFKVMDLATGDIEKDFVAENLPGFPMHPRCYPSRATTRYIMTNGMGTEFYRIGGTTVDINNVVRGSCIYGVMPSNGLLYKPADSCACYYQSKLEYFCALAPAAAEPERHVPESQRLERGPAYDTVRTRRPAAPARSDWPMYRSDAARSGCCESPVPADLKEAWSVRLGGKLTQPVVVGDTVFIAAVNEHTLYALDSQSGKIRWQFTAGGRIDSSPTVYGGTVLFGSADGWAYCLDAADGALAWRYRVALGDKRIVSYEQLESAWPVSGSVLVYDGVAYCLAGRNMFFDGGLRLVRLDPASGRLLSENVMDENDPETGKNLQTLIVQKYMPVANADLLSCDGQNVYMQAQKFDLEGRRRALAPKERDAEGGRHLFCQTGLLDDVWFHRSFWIYGDRCGEGWGNYTDPRRVTPCGRIMAFDDSRVYAFQADPLGNMLHPRQTYRLYAADKNPAPPPAIAETPDAPSPKKRRAAKPAAKIAAAGFRVHWQDESLPLLVNAMTLGGGRLFIAGPPDVADETAMLGFLPGADDAVNRELHEQERAWLGQKGGILWVVSADDGRKLAEYRMQSYPVFDGMSTAGGSLYLAQLDGTLVKYAGAD